jgi:hypothetical protein
MLELIVNKQSTTSNLNLKLYGNNGTPGDQDNAVGTFWYTEISGGGYLQKVLDGAVWGVANGNNCVATYTAQTWSFTGATTPNTVYGYYVTQNVGGRLMWSERFTDGPYAINNNGDAITITPRIELEG